MAVRAGGWSGLNRVSSLNDSPSGSCHRAGASSQFSNKTSPPVKYIVLTPLLSPLLSLTPLLSQAAQDGDAKKVKSLLKKKVNPNRHDSLKGFVEVTSLHVAVSYGHLEITKELLAFGANVEALGCHDQRAALRYFSALGVAAAMGHTDLIRVLLKAKADKEKQSCTDGYSKRTPLMLAAERGHQQIVEVLIKAGANVNAGERNAFNPNECPLGLAQQAGHKKIADLLEKTGAVSDALH